MLAPSLVRLPDPLITPAKVVLPVLVPMVSEVFVASETLELAAPVSEAICWLAALVNAELPVPVSSMITALRVLVGMAPTTLATSAPALRM